MTENSKEDDVPQARVGTVIKGKWTIESLLGVGGMAAVYAASHRNGQRAALKILHADFARDKAICERFLREAYVSNKVNHGATVQVLDDDVTDSGDPFLIMELLEGETVRDAWKKSGRTMPIGRALQICERVVDCLASCHAIKVIHRDLKPANIFVLREDEVRVLDFGVAQMRDATSERTATGTALGTPAYMSPEQAMGLVDQLDGRADLFSVGAMLHALTTGYRINNGRTDQEALVMAATKPVPSVARLAPKLPIDLIKVIDKSLAWDRRNRFQSAREMQKALLELMPANAVVPLVGRPPPRPHEVVAPPPPEILAVLQSPAGEARVGSSPPAPKPAAAATATVEAAPLVEPPRPLLPTPRASIAMSAVQVPVAPAPRASIAMSAVNVANAGPMRRVSMAMGALTPNVPAVDPLLGGLAPSLLPQAMRSAPPIGGASDTDLRVPALRDLMRHFDRLFPSVRQFGWTHPATERALQTAFDAFTEALRQQPTLVDWTLRPYSFMTLGQTVWEPGAPFDAIPYNLFACGIRSLRIEPGITLTELRELFTLCLLDPGRDLPPEDDLAAALWERALPHVKWLCVDAFAEGDAAEREAFYGEADELEQLAEAAAKNQLNRLEVEAMALSTDEAALERSKVKSPFALDDANRKHVAHDFALSREAWAERFVDALVEGYLDSAAHRDAPLVLASLRRSATDLVVAGRFDVAVQINLAVIERLRERVQGAESQHKLAAAITNAMFGGESLAIALKHVRENPRAIDLLAAVLPGISPAELSTVLAALREVSSEPLRQLLASFIEPYVAGREADVAKAAIGAEPVTAVYLVDLLQRMGTPAARQGIERLGQQSEDINMYAEARLRLAPSPEHGAREMSTLLENTSALIRMAALRASMRHSLRNVWPTIARSIAAKHFNDLGSDERRELLRACVILSPERGEPILLDLARKGGVLSSGEREASRAVAAELLGELSQTRATAMALQEIASSRWGVSDETRLAAANSAKQIGLRLSHVGGAGA